MTSSGHARYHLLFEAHVFLVHVYKNKGHQPRLNTLKHMDFQTIKTSLKKLFFIHYRARLTIFNIDAHKLTIMNNLERIKL